MDTEWNELCWIIIFRPTEAFTRGILIPIFYSDYFRPCKRSWGVLQPFSILRHGALYSHLVWIHFQRVSTRRRYSWNQIDYFMVLKNHFLWQQLEKALSVSKTKKQNSEPVQCAQYGNRPRTNNVLIVCALASLLVLMWEEEGRGNRTAAQPNLTIGKTLPVNGTKAIYSCCN